jgi:glutathione S-transferase
LFDLVRNIQNINKIGNQRSYCYCYKGRKDFKVIEENEKILPQYFAVLDQALNGKKYLNGNEFTLADLNVASVASIAHPIGFDMSPYKNINAWMGAIAERPSFHKYMSLRK